LFAYVLFAQYLIASNYSALPVTVQLAVKIVLSKAKNVSLQV